jgi:hypothetical protein
LEWMPDMGYNDVSQGAKISGVHLAGESPAATRGSSPTA